MSIKMNRKSTLIFLISIFAVGSMLPFLFHMWQVYIQPDITKIELANIKVKQVFLSVILSFGVHLISAIWLFTQAKIKIANKYIWAFFALTSGILAIILFYAMHIYENQNS